MQKMKVRFFSRVAFLLFSTITLFSSTYALRSFDEIINDMYRYGDFESASNLFQELNPSLDKQADKKTFSFIQSLVACKDALTQRDSYFLMGGVMLVSLVYGVLLNQATVRMCPEYKSMSRLFGINGADNPTMQGLLGGITDAFLPGLAISIAATLAAHLGDIPNTFKFSDIEIKDAGILVGGVSLATVCAGLVGFIVQRLGGESGHISTRFYACSYAHKTALVSSLVAGAILCCLILKKRIDRNDELFNKVIKNYKDMLKRMEHETKEVIINAKENAIRSASDSLRQMSLISRGAY